MITVSKRFPHTPHITDHTPNPNPRPRLVIHSSAARIYYSPAPASPGNYPFYLYPHPDIQQHLVNAPALTEPGPEAEAGGCFDIVHGT